MEKARREGKATHEGWRAKKSGEVFWGYVVITALRDSTGKIFGFSKVTRDLTERKEAELMLHKYAESLQEKNKALEQNNKRSWNHSAMWPVMIYKNHYGRLRLSRILFWPMKRINFQNPAVIILSGSFLPQTECNT